jgi:DNA ligase-4
VLKIHDSLDVAISVLRRAEEARPSSTIYDLRKSLDPSLLVPIIGIKIGRQPFHIGRGIKHCMDMIRGRRAYVEKKYDGEYCQIHIDLSAEAAQQIKIFSKSGKDSTNDRKLLHG